MGDSGRRHTDQEYERELEALRDRLQLMGTRVEEMLAASMLALEARDGELARRLIEHDRDINRLEMEIDEHCLHILARRQPVASDLRFLTAALKLVTDLERIGDLCVNVCERVLELNDEPPLQTYTGLALMADEAGGMILDALDAFMHGDVERAQQVCARDRAVDDLYVHVFRELLTHMMEDASSIPRATRLQSIAKYIERIGDHATNIAEMAVFRAKGKDIRHPASRSPPGDG